MTQLIEIENNLVRIVDRTIVREAALSDVLPHIEYRPPVNMFHPRSVVFTHWNESNGSRRRVKYLCELEPGIRGIVKNDRRFRLAIPWTYFVFSFESDANSDMYRGENWSMVDYAVFHAPNKVRSPQDRLWTAFLPNVYEDGRICFGTTGVRTDQPLMDRVDQMVNDWYLTQFNNDVHGGRNHPLPFNGRLPNGWAHWVRATQEHGLLAYTMFPEWNMTNNENGATSYTLETLLNHGAINSRVGQNLRVLVTDAIPEIPTPMTFGRAEEWLRGQTPDQRFRLQVALTNIGADDPTAITPPPPPVLNPDDPTEDGGEPVQR